MAANNETKIVLTAEDRTGAAIESVKRGMKGMETYANKVREALGAIGVTFGAASAIAFVKGTIDAADGMNDLSQKVGINIKQLAGWTLAANQSGTSMESVAKGIKGLSGFMVEHSDKLRAAGVTATDANGAMIQLADIFKDMPDGVDKTALAVKLFGKAGMDMIPMLNLGSQGLAEAQEKAAAYGKKLAELAPDADRFNDQMEELALQSKVAGMNIAQYFIPGLIGLSAWLNDVATGGEKALQATEWMFGERYTRALALTGRVTAGSRTSGGKIGGAAPVGMSLADEEKLGAGNIAGIKARQMLDDAAKKAGGYKRSFDPEGDLESARLEREFQEGKKRANASVQDSDKEAKRQVEAQEKLRQKYVEMADPLQKYRLELDEINLLREKGLLSAAQAIEAEWKVNEAMDKAFDTMKNTGEAMKENSNFARDMGMSFTSAFEDAVIGGKKASDVIRGLGQDIGRIIMRKGITEPFGNAVSGFIKNIDFGNLFKAEGGPVTGGQSYIVGERGPEWFTPASSGTITPNHQLAAGGTTNHFTVDMRGASVEAVARLEQLVISVNGSIERRALNVMGQARVRGV